MSSVPEKNDDVFAQENGVVVADDEMKSNDSDNSLSSSIGVLSDGVGVEEEEVDEAESSALEDSLNSLQSLEAALPFKRGISGFYTGKSKSFVNLAEVKCLKEMEKEENPLNKRRRLTIAQNNTLYKWGSNSSSMPHLTRSDGGNAYSVGVEQEFKSSTNRACFSSIDNSTP
ncbi:hypothetical protein K7X08_029090 [Anisodus acutangulus]|uniref:Uncharacterized protein n=1 Tax=Anisodus acutangulus TaxID=402998 RepID=A0A9Q1L3M6_9SOLA|nr:hypothetical protein K7X08_029090 [Anisodus acutangulus]